MATVRSAHLLIFTQQFASMIRSNLQLVDVLDNLARETPQAKLREVVEVVSHGVKHGVDLGDAMAEHPNVFSDVYVNVIRAGMASGRLGESISQITNYLAVMDTVNRKVRSALSYPVFMLIAFFLVFNGMVIFILPRFAKMFSSFNRELPIPTRILLNVGDYWVSNWYLIVGGLVIGGVTFTAWIASEDGRAIWDKNKLKLPLMGSIWRMGALSRFLRTLAVQIKNEVPILEALVLSAEASDNVFIRETIYQIAEDVEHGAGLSNAFREHDIFHGIVLQMIAAGEEAGTLDELMLSSADYFERLLNDRLEAVTGLINPLLTVFVGLAVAGMMIASFLPVFQIGAVVS